MTPEQSSTGMENRVGGEDTPTWLIAVYAAIGTLVAGAAAWLALDASPGHALRAATAQEQSVPPATTREFRSPAVSGAGGDGPDAVPASPATAAAHSAVPHDAGGGSGAATAQGLAKPEKCPPALRIPFKLESAEPIVHGIQPALDELRAFLDRHPQARLSVEGHADSSGTEDHNLVLSYRRAKAVVSLLSSSGPPERRMVIRAAGDNAPLDGLPRDSGENRRVVLQILGMENCRETPGASPP